jgi:hypothetical protein
MPSSISSATTISPGLQHYLCSTTPRTTRRAPQAGAVLKGWRLPHIQSRSPEQHQASPPDLCQAYSTDSCSRRSPCALTMRGYRGRPSQYKIGRTEMHVRGTAPVSQPSGAASVCKSLAGRMWGCMRSQQGYATRAGWPVKDGRSGRRYLAEGCPVASRSSIVGDVRAIPCRFRALGTE